MSADQVLGEMEELVKWLNDDDSMLLDPVERAAIAHYKLVCRLCFIIVLYISVDSFILPQFIPY